MHSNGCSGTKAEIRYLEHVQLLLSLDYSRRGDLVVYLTSPMGTKSCLLSIRREDLSDEGFTKWPFMTTHSWGEDPRGTWTLEIKDLGDNRTNHGTLTEWQLILHGTKEKPNHQTIAHPDKPRDSVPVPETSPSSSPQVPRGPTYTFGSIPVTPESPVKYVAPQVVTYTAPPAPNPAVLTLAAQSLVQQQVQKPQSNQFVPNTKQTLQVGRTYPQQANIAAESVYSAVQPIHSNYIVPSNYHENPIANYYHYTNNRGYLPQVRNPVVPQATDQLGFHRISWSEAAAAAYRSRLPFNNYPNYLRTLGRRGAGRDIEHLKSKKNKLKRT